MFVNLAGLQIEEFFVADVLQHQGFLAVADDDPIALPNFGLLHALPLAQTLPTAIWCDRLPDR
jgi:hypothetical protein